MVSIKNCLTYWGFMFSGLGRDYVYTPPVGGFVNNDATEYAAITGPDAGIIPPFVYTAGDPIFPIQADIWVAEKFAGDNFPALSSTVSGHTATLASLGSPPKVYFGSTLQTLPIMYTKSATVASGVAVFYLTTDGTSTGTALFPTGPNMDSINAFVSDATASYQMSYALTNSNKTLTVTANKLTTANILTGILGQASANGAIVRVTLFGN